MLVIGWFRNINLLVLLGYLLAVVPLLNMAAAAWMLRRLARLTADYATRLCRRSVFRERANRPYRLSDAARVAQSRIRDRATN